MMAKDVMKVVAVRVPPVVERQLRRLAREDDRRLSPYLRRRLEELVAEQRTDAAAAR